MKSCLGILLVFFTFVSVIGGGALIWYLSSTAEFTRKDAARTSSSSSGVPKANVPIPPAVPKAHLVPSAPPAKTPPKKVSPFGERR